MAHMRTRNQLPSAVKSAPNCIFVSETFDLPAVNAVITFYLIYIYR